MNWGKGIVLGMSLFIVFILVLVIILMRQNVNLESADYYSKEINYEKELVAMRNAEAMDEKIKAISQEDHLVLQLPQEGDFGKVTIKLIRPDNNTLDKEYSFDDTRSFLIEKSELSKGAYKLEILYTFMGKECLQKETIYI
jgi:hypothetical protein